uniref:Uncharacterized protein n=1 Tax=Romanomermis culicivorax TaxID=13658 RepID=A0A915I8K2_ROMCU
MPEADVVNKMQEGRLNLAIPRFAIDVGHSVAVKVAITKSTCKLTMGTGGTDNLHSNRAPQKEEQMILFILALVYHKS